MSEEWSLKPRNKEKKGDEEYYVLNSTLLKSQKVC